MFVKVHFDPWDINHIRETEIYTLISKHADMMISNTTSLQTKSESQHSFLMKIEKSNQWIERIKHKS